MDPKTSEIRESYLKWYGWGYQNTYFVVNSKDQVEFHGTTDRYKDLCGKVLPNLVPWMETNLGINIKDKLPDMPVVPPLGGIPQGKVCDEFLFFLQNKNIEFSLDPLHRLTRSHGQTVYEIMHLRTGKYGRIPDVVVWPSTTEVVLALVKAAESANACIIPFAGGTNVTDALAIPEHEHRFVICMDMTHMKRLLWIDKFNLFARAEAGIIGQDLEKLLNDEGFTLGHEPDSVEFSSLGGWIATRASGMRKNKYGNIEDLVVHITFVTARGIMQRNCQVPRLSAGPDILSFILGSEGTLGVVTEASFKIQRLPECKLYDSLVFPDFESGFNCLREIAAQKCAPASIRLVDNDQFRFGQALKPETGALGSLQNALKKLYVTRWKGFDPMHMCVATLVFEGSQKEVEQQKEEVMRIGSKHRAFSGGAENGRYGYMLTFAIAYLRDLGFYYNVIGESFETSVPWDRVLDLCRNVKELLQRESKRHGIKYPIYSSCRIAQVYDAGACVYFYYGFNYKGLADPLKVYEEIEIAARNEILSCGGSISHHHGVGKLRKRFMRQTVGDVGLSALAAIKKELDPNNTFCSGNLFDCPKL